MKEKYNPELVQELTNLCDVRYEIVKDMETGEVIRTVTNGKGEVTKTVLKEARR